MKTLRKYRSIAIVLLIAIVALVGCLGRAEDEAFDDAVDEMIDALAIGPRPHAPYLSHYVTETATGNWAILVDLSDNTNYPHAATNSIILRGVEIHNDVSNEMDWKLELGVVTIADTSGITVEHIAIVPLLADRRLDTGWNVPEHGVNLLVSNDSLIFVATNSTTGTAIVTSTVMIEGVEGAAMPAVGDLVIYTREISDTATLRLSVSTAYDTE